MPQQNSTFAENNFTKGLITDSTGLNFPENAATDTDNCIYTITGDVLRRLGVDFETNYGPISSSIGGSAINSYLWNNAGGDGASQILVEQVGGSLYFYLSSNATPSVPLSRTLIFTKDFSVFRSSGAVANFIATECQFSDGNGYLFVYHPFCQPFYCSFVPQTNAMSFNTIDIRIRDFTGIPESIDVNFRPLTLSDQHKYNLLNQGWVSNNPWTASSTTSYDTNVHSQVFTVASGITGIVGGQSVQIIYSGPDIFTGAGLLTSNSPLAAGNVTSYVGTSLTINVSAVNSTFAGSVLANWSIVPISGGLISTWFTAIGNYPSNADVWWYFKDNTGAYSPAASASTSFSTGGAPRGHFILSAFNQQKGSIGGVNVTSIVTSKRPSTGTWFQGRVWYTGVDDLQTPTGDAPFYTWTENIYFSQIVTGVADFGSCFQTNDPTSENLFDLLPTDGGVITIQGSGKIYKLFPIQNGMLVFAANGVWFITGNQGIGFTANDYTITKISSVRSISSTSFVNVQGLPFFWNEEAIYSVMNSQQGQLSVEPLTVGTIGTFYEAIPLLSKKYVRGAYNPIDYKIQWLFKGEVETTVTSRYQFDRALNYNTFNKAFYPSTYTGVPSINSITYVSSPGNAVNAPEPTFKYFVSYSNTLSTFADEHDEDCLDFFSYDNVGTSYDSFFVTGFKLRGQAIRKFQPIYIQVYSRVGEIDGGYNIQGIWDFAIKRNSGRWTNLQKADVPSDSNLATSFRRHKIRGHGFVLQFKITSQDGKPFDIQGWAVADAVNAGT